MSSSLRVPSRLAALAASLLALSCAGDRSPSVSGNAPVPSEAQIGETFATVNGMPIGLKEFDTLAARQMGRDGSIDEATRDEIVERLVDEKLLYMRALAEGVDRDPKIQKMMVNTLLKDHVYSKVRTSEISEDDLVAYFEEHKEEFVVPEKVHIKRILIKVEDGESPEATRARAEEVHAAATANESDFAVLAKRHSKGPFGPRGGEIGFVRPEGKPGVDPAVVAAAFALDGTGISEIFETPDGWNIVYVPKRRARVERTFRQMRGSVLRKVKAGRYKSLYEGYVDDLRVGAIIDVDRDRVASHRIRAVRPLNPAASGARAPVDRGAGTGGEGGK